MEARDPQYEQRVRASFARQAIMARLGATIDRVVPGEVTLGDWDGRPSVKAAELAHLTC